jgi:hypothetical protein
MSADRPTREVFIDVKLLLGIFRSLAQNCRATFAIVGPGLSE